MVINITIGIAIAYVLLTLPLMVFGFRRAWKGRPKVETLAVETLSSLPELEKALKTAFGPDVKIHEIPENTAEVAMLTSQKLIASMEESSRLNIAWLTNIRDKADINKRDMDTVMIALKTISDLLLATKPVPEKESKGLHLEKFLNELRYADRFAETETQKKALMGIISNAEKVYGTGTK